MRPVEKISAPLKCMLLAFFLWGCTQNEKILPERVGYLTADFDNVKEEKTEFPSILVSEKKVNDVGKVSLAVKVESESGGKVEFIILNYQKNSIYKIEEVEFKEYWYTQPDGDSSGSLRYCTSGRFFLNMEKDGIDKLRFSNKGTF